MEILCTKKDRNLTVQINGEIDHHYAEEIREKIDKEFSRANAKNIVFDFSNVSFMDSSGIGMVIGRYKKVEKLGGKVFIASIPKELDKLFQVSGLHKIIATYDNIEDAIASL